ncbi:MAG: hypothetical protein EOP17_08095 [Rhizobiaceae bacterium]|nr:MAG: hypothetical protein EOP17_08095 [Rhizobiaceae bacterium]
MLRASFAVAALFMMTMPASAKVSAPEKADIIMRIGETFDTIINDQPIRFHMAPDAISVPTLNADAAERAGLKPSMIGYVYVIGPEKIAFRTDNVAYGTQDASFRRRTAFSNRQIVAAADGIAGPETFSSARTTFVLRDPQPGDRAITFPLDKELGRSQTSVRLDVGGYQIYAAFSTDRVESLVTATGGRWIADANGGRFAGEARAAPILYGVSRPVRSLALARPLVLGELEIRNLAVRVSDVGDAQGIEESRLADQDADEIVVTADSTRKVPKQRLYIGMDTIGHCASITYDFAAGNVTLMCPAQSRAVPVA